MFYCLLDLRSDECNAVSLYVLCCLSMDLFFLGGMFVNCLVKQFAICLGGFVIVECDGVVECGWRCMYGLP